jgi:hypothetical protein
VAEFGGETEYGDVRFGLSQYRPRRLALYIMIEERE